VLIESQVRLARSGLQAVSEVAGALYPAASVVTSSLKAADAGTSTSPSEQAAVGVRVRQEAEAGRAHLQSLRASMRAALSAVEAKVDAQVKARDDEIKGKDATQQKSIQDDYAAKARSLYKTELAPVFNAYGEQIKIYGQRLGPEGLVPPLKPTDSSKPADSSKKTDSGENK
jgi:hypothetical protein